MADKHLVQAIKDMSLADKALLYEKINADAGIFDVEETAIPMDELEEVIHSRYGRDGVNAFLAGTDAPNFNIANGYFRLDLQKNTLVSMNDAETNEFLNKQAEAAADYIEDLNGPTGLELPDDVYQILEKAGVLEQAMLF